MCVFVVYMHADVGVEVSRGSHQVPSSVSLPLSLNWSLPIQQNSLAHKLQGCFCLCLPSTGFTGMYSLSCLAFSRGARKLNSGPHACTASTWPTEASPYFRNSLLVRNVILPHELINRNSFQRPKFISKRMHRDFELLFSGFLQNPHRQLSTRNKIPYEFIVF